MRIGKFKICARRHARLAGVLRIWFALPIRGRVSRGTAQLMAASSKSTVLYFWLLGTIASMAHFRGRVRQPNERDRSQNPFGRPSFSASRDQPSNLCFAESRELSFSRSSAVRYHTRRT